jgi:hypothetical protein
VLVPNKPFYLKVEAFEKFMPAIFKFTYAAEGSLQAFASIKHEKPDCVSNEKTVKKDKSFSLVYYEENQVYKKKAQFAAENVFLMI